MTPKTRILLLPALLLTVAGPCPGQGTAAADKPAPLAIHGSFRTRLEAWDWFESDADGSYAFLGSIARLSLGQQRETLDWQVEFAAPFLLGLPENAIAPAPQGQLGLGATYYAINDRSRNTGMAFVKQGFVRFKGRSHSLRLGRFEFIDGSEVTPKNGTLAAIKRSRVNHRLIGNFGFSHVGRSVDGFQYSYNKPGGNFTLVGAVPTRGVFQVDGWGNLRAAFAYASGTKPVNTARNTGELRVFSIYYHDWRDVVKTDNRPVAARRADGGNVRLGAFGGHYLHAAETTAGVFDFLFWGNVQTGRWGIQDHRAGAVAVEGGYQPSPSCPLKPWVRAGFFHGSGDDNPLDDKHGTFFQMLPTPRIYARFPFYNFMNNQDLFGTLTLRPHKSLGVAGGIHAVRLADRNDLWYLGGGAFQPWSFGFVGRPSQGNRGLATIYDVSLDYQVNAAVAVSGYFGHANGKSVLSGIYPKGKNGRFGFLELNYRF